MRRSCVWLVVVATLSGFLMDDSAATQDCHRRHQLFFQEEGNFMFYTMPAVLFPNNSTFIQQSTIDSCAVTFSHGDAHVVHVMISTIARTHRVYKELIPCPEANGAVSDLHGECGPEFGRKSSCAEKTFGFATVEGYLYSSNIRMAQDCQQQSMLNYADAKLGLGYEGTWQDGRHRDIPWSMLQHSHNKVFALDLNGINGHSYVEFGGYNDTFGDVVPVWSTMQSGDRLGAVFTAYHLSMCGVSLLSNYSSSWPVVVDTVKPFLEVPRELYDSLIAWLPVRCTVVDPSVDYCVFASKPDTLPSMSFHLSEVGPPVAIDLNNLVILNGDRYEFAVRTGRSVMNPDKSRYSVDPPFIYLGNLALQSLLIVFDLSAQRLGFASKKHNRTDLSLHNCLPLKECKGDQTLYHSLNICEDPSCDDYFFQEVDMLSKKCVMLQGLKMLLWSVVAIIVAVEFGLNEAYMRVQMKLDGRRQTL